MKQNISRRDFLRRLGLGTAALTGAALVGCDSKKNPVTGEPTVDESDVAPSLCL